MWKWFHCYLSGGHEFGVWGEPGMIYLRCLHCGKRSTGWAMGGGNPRPADTSPVARFPAQNVLRSSSGAVWCHRLRSALPCLDGSSTGKDNRGRARTANH